MGFSAHLAPPGAPLRRPRVGLALLLTLTGLCGAAPARSQPPRRLYEMRIPISVPRYGRPPMPPLPPAEQERLERARTLRSSGRPDAARDALLRVLTAAPHHPLALAEMAGLHAARRAWRAVETLARSERAATRDSLLLAEDLVEAIDRQGRPREAAEVVFEAWIAEPRVLDWARGWLDTLASADPRGVRELARRSVAALPARGDLAHAVARLEWRFGDAPSALRLLAAAEKRDGTPARWTFAQEVLANGTARDSAGAIEALIDLAADRGSDDAYRLPAARRAWEIATCLGAGSATAPRVARALKDVPADRWGAALIVPVMRGLREGGLDVETRSLLVALGGQGGVIPEIALERAMGDLREGPPEKPLPALRALSDTLPEAAFRYAEALFFAGQPESAAVHYTRVARDPAGANTGASLERLYLIEEGGPREGLIALGRLAYEQWRGDSKRSLALADSLYRSLVRGPLWSQVALTLAALRESGGDGKGAIEPLLALADGLPDDRLAPVARQRAGDAYRIWDHDNAKALAQYEECLARYPKAWNAPEVRRWVETLRRERRF